MPPPMIDIEKLHYAPEGQEVLQGITLRTSARRVGIVGRNGSGKTTLARLMAGLVAPTRGQVRIDGVDVLKDRKTALRTVGILFQNPDHQIIFPTVEEELSFGLKQQGLAPDEVRLRVRKLLDQFGKGHWAPAAIHQLSQGQRQLVCLMSILAMEPRVILLDEPFAGLDIPTRTHLQRLLAGLEVTLVQITHEPEAIADWDEVVWLEKGGIEAVGSPATVLPAYRKRMQQLGAWDDLSDLAS